MSSDIRSFQTEDITDMATAKLALRWSLEKVRQLDTDIQSLNARLADKDAESTRLSRELARSSTESLNEREITSKTQQLLDEYRVLMSASMEQLWRKYAPQEAETRRRLEDRATALEHDLDQTRRRLRDADDNAQKAENSMARADRERLELAEQIRLKEMEVVGLREKVVSIEPEVQRLYSEKLRQMQEEFTAKIAMLQDQMVVKERDLQERMSHNAMMVERERASAKADADHRFEAKKAELERQREGWLRDLEHERLEIRQEFDRERRSLQEKAVSIELMNDERRRTLDVRDQEVNRQLADRTARLNKETAEKQGELVQQFEKQETDRKLAWELQIASLNEDRRLWDAERYRQGQELELAQKNFTVYEANQKQRLIELETTIRNTRFDDVERRRTEVTRSLDDRASELERRDEALGRHEQAADEKMRAIELEKLAEIEDQRRTVLANLEEERRRFQTFVQTETDRLARIERDRRETWEVSTRDERAKIDAEQKRLAELEVALREQSELDRKKFESERSIDFDQRLRQMETETAENIRLAEEAARQADDQRDRVYTGMRGQLERQFSEKEHALVLERQEWEAQRSEMQRVLEKDRRGADTDLNQRREHFATEQQEAMQKRRQEQEIWEAGRKSEEKRLADMESQLQQRFDDEQRLWQAKVKEDRDRLDLLEKDLLLKVENEKATLQQRAEEITQHVEQMESDVQRRAEEERTASQAKLDGEWARLETEERLMREKFTRDQNRFQVRSEETLRARRDELEKELQERRNELETFATDDQERRNGSLAEFKRELERSFAAKDDQFRLEREEFEASKRRDQLELEDKRLIMEEEVSRIEQRKRKLEQEASESLAEVQRQNEQRAQAEARRLADAERQLADRRAEIEREASAAQQRAQVLERNLRETVAREQEAQQRVIADERVRLTETEAAMDERLAQEKKNLEVQLDESLRRRSAELDERLEKRSRELETISEQERLQYARMFESKRAELEKQLTEKEALIMRERREGEDATARVAQDAERRIREMADKYAALEARLKRETERALIETKAYRSEHDEEWEKKQAQMESERRRLATFEAELTAATELKETAHKMHVKKEEERLTALEKSLNEQIAQNKKAWEDTMLRDTQQMDKFEKDLRARIALEQKNWEMKAEQSHRGLSQELETMWQGRAKELEAIADMKEAEREKEFNEMKAKFMDEVRQKEDHITEMRRRLEDEMKAGYAKMEETIRVRTQEQEAAWAERAARLQKKVEDDDTMRQKITLEKQTAFEQMEKKYLSDSERIEKENQARLAQLDQQRQRWAREHDETLAQLEAAKKRVEGESLALRESYRIKEEKIETLLRHREKEYDDYKKTVETEWPARFENRVNEIADKTRKQLAEKEAEFAIARQQWIEEATDMKMKLSARMNELQESFTQKEEDLQRRFLQKQHDLTTQVEKTMSELKAKQLEMEKQTAEYTRLNEDTNKRKEELEGARKDLTKRLETMAQEFMRQQSIMDEQLRRVQNEKHELRTELEDMARRKAA